MNSFRKLKAILFSLLFGILFLQCIWIYDAYKEQKKQFSNHLNNSVSHAINQYCNTHDALNLETQINIKQAIRKELLSLSEHPEFTLKLINTENINRDKKYPNRFFFPIKSNQCNGIKSLEIDIKAYNNYLLGAIVSWIALSAIFIVLLSIFTTIYLRNINIQKQIQKMKDEFTSNMTHELKTPISTITVASEILLNENISLNKEKTRRYAEIIHEENNRLKALVDRVMQVALFENGKLILNLKEENIHQIIEDLSQPLLLIIHKRHGNLNIQLHANNPMINIDKSHITNVISNLVENAIKYSSNHPQISISTNSLNSVFEIIIEDQGMGIDKKDIKHIFDKYYRANNKNQDQKSGFGLGLFYVYQVIKGHNGSITVESDINKGSKFIIHLPIA